jgi:hypothetical protein
MPFGDQHYKDNVAGMTMSQLEAEKKALNRKLAGHLAKEDMQRMLCGKSSSLNTNLLLPAPTIHTLSLPSKNIS